MSSGLVKDRASFDTYLTKAREIIAKDADSKGIEDPLLKGNRILNFVSNIRKEFKISSGLYLGDEYEEEKLFTEGNAVSFLQHHNNIITRLETLENSPFVKSIFNDEVYQGAIEAEKNQLRERVADYINAKAFGEVPTNETDKVSYYKNTTLADPDPNKNRTYSTMKEYVSAANAGKINIGDPVVVVGKLGVHLGINQEKITIANETFNTPIFYKMIGVE